MAKFCSRRKLKSIHGDDIAWSNPISLLNASARTLYNVACTDCSCAKTPIQKNGMIENRRTKLKLSRIRASTHALTHQGCQTHKIQKANLATSRFENSQKKWKNLAWIFSINAKKESNFISIQKGQIIYLLYWHTLSKRPHLADLACPNRPDGYPDTQCLIYQTPDSFDIAIITVKKRKTSYVPKIVIILSRGCS